MSRYCCGDVVSYLDRYLPIDAFSDDPRALNGLQVENSGRLTQIGAAVDACQASIDAACAADVSLLLVHHGLFWHGLEPLVGPQARRIRALLQRDVALYSAHLPLDAHPEVGNNAVLARELGLRNLAPFGEYDGKAIGLRGEMAITRDQLRDRLGQLLGSTPKVIEAGPVQVQRVGIVSGAGSGALSEAVEAGLDTFITGEGPHHSYLDAEESGINLIYAGHYATETVGVKALAAHVADRFGLPWLFFDHPTGL